MSDYIGASVLSVDDEKVSVNESGRVKLHRDGARPLVGEATVLGYGYRVGTGTTLHVWILRRRSGYAVYTVHKTIWEGSADSYTATLCTDAQAVLGTLGGDSMRRAEKEAWKEAVTHDKQLEAISTVEL